MVRDEVLAFGEGDAVDGVGREEDPVLQHALGFEVWPHLRGVDVVLRLAHLLGVERPSPSSPASNSDADLACRSFCSALRCARRGLPACAAWRRRPPGVLAVSSAVTTAAWLGNPRSAARFALQPRDLEHDVAVVVFAAAAAAAAGCGHDPLAKGPVGQRREVRMTGRQHESDEVLAVEPALLCRLSGGGDLAASPSPSSSATSSTTTARSLVSASRFFSNLVSRLASVWLYSLQRRLVVVAQASAGDRELVVVALDQVNGLGVEAQGGRVGRAATLMRS